MKIIMTGATGWIGQKLGLELVRAGHELTCLVRSPQEARQKCPFPAHWVAWDGLSDLLPTQISGADAVVHLMGEPIAKRRWSSQIKTKIYSSRIESTKKLMTLARAIGVSTFVSTSAIGYYGNRGDEQLTEESSAGDDFLANVCRDWEHEVLQWASQMRCVCLRLGVVFGKDGGALQEMLPAFKVGAGGPLAGGDQWMSWIHIEDVVRLFCEALENPKYVGVYNATAPEPVRQKELARCLGQILQRPAILPAPGAILRTLFGEMAEIFLSSCHAIPERALKNKFQFLFYKLKPALEDCLQGETGDQREFLTRQFVPQKLESVFPFFSDVNNLEKITPPYLQFKVLKTSTPQIQRGTLIDYKLRLHGIPFGWRTQIDEWNPPHRFVDTQLKGPYSLWHHTHSFESLGQGTLLTDKVLYQLPMGPLGRWVAGHKVKNDIAGIFAYRQKIIADNFGNDHLN